MTSLLGKTCLVYDHAGLYLHIGLALAKGFGRVLYFTEWRDAFSSSKGRMIGEGFEEVERIRDFHNYLDDADIVVFPDMGAYALQGYLRKQGMPVWGMGDAEQLEDDKVFFHNWLLGQGLAASDMWEIEGIDALRSFLREHKDVYVKSNDRGDFETYHHHDWRLTEPWFNDLIAKIGPYKDTLRLIAQKPVKGVEVGYDGYLIDGSYPATAQLGLELKDQGYVARLMPFTELPAPVIHVCQIISEWTADSGFVGRGAFSSEIRLASADLGYFIDPTMRFGLPPSVCQAAAWENLSEIVWAGAHGELVDIKCPFKYVAEIELTSDWAAHHFMPVYWPEEHEGLIALYRWHRDEGTNYVVPKHAGGGLVIGAAAGYGQTVQEAAEMAGEVAQSIEAFDVDFNKNAFDELDRVLDDYAALGLEF